MTTRELFEDILPRILRESPERARELSGVIAFDLRGEGGGLWTVDPEVQPPCVLSGRSRAPVCTITAAAADFDAMLTDPKAALRLYQEGRIQVTGDASLAKGFHRLFR